MKLPFGEFSPKELNIFAAIDAYMHGTTSLESVSSTLAEPIEQDYSNGGHSSAGYVAGYASDDPDDPPSICNLYSCVIRYARTLSWDDSVAHLKLIALLDAFWARNEPPNPPGEEGAMWHSGWWAGQLTDEWENSPNSEWTGREVKSMLEDGEEWTNVNAFLAYFTQNNDEAYWINGFYALRDVLEPDDFERPDIWAEGVGLEIYLPSAAVWILITGVTLWSVVNKTEDDDSCIEQISSERWDEWKTAFQEIAHGMRGDASERTKKMASDAAIRMEKIESQESVLESVL